MPNIRVPSAARSADVSLTPESFAGMGANILRPGIGHTIIQSQSMASEPAVGHVNPRSRSLHLVLASGQERAVDTVMGRAPSRP